MRDNGAEIAFLKSPISEFGGKQHDGWDVRHRYEWVINKRLGNIELIGPEACIEVQCIPWRCYHLEKLQYLWICTLPKPTDDNSLFALFPKKRGLLRDHPLMMTAHWKTSCHWLIGHRS